MQIEFFFSYFHPFAPFELKARTSANMTSLIQALPRAADVSIGPYLQWLGLPALFMVASKFHVDNKIRDLVRRYVGGMGFLQGKGVFGAPGQDSWQWGDYITMFAYGVGGSAMVFYGAPLAWDFVADRVGKSSGGL